MKIAVINFSGNVGKSTLARHLLLPRIPGAKLLGVESLNSDEGGATTVRGRQFADLQEYLQTVESAVVDIGASNVEELMSLMRMYHGSHEDIDCFVVPTVPPVKQQKDTTATLLELASLGVSPSRLRVVFNMVELRTEVERTFEPLLAFLAAHPIAIANPRAYLSANELYARVKRVDGDIGSLAAETTNFKDLINKAATVPEKLQLAQKLATHRLARGVLPELDACFEALNLGVEVSVTP